MRTTNVELLGQVRQGIYDNSVYGFEFAVPDGWFVASSGRRSIQLRNTLGKV